MKGIRTFLFTMVILLGLVAQAHATLYLRGTDGSGNQLIYDDYFDITWYDYTNDGQNWEPQRDWALALTVDFLGATFDNWRLPTAFNSDGSGPFSGYDCHDTEMGHLYYIDLGNPQDVGSSLNTSFIDGFTGDEESFLNLVAAAGMYWLAEPDSDGLRAWVFSFDYGRQDRAPLESWCFGLAVHPGDVAPVPEPATMLLLGFGLIGLAAARRKFQK